jgi:hypothetical protein
MAWFTPFIIPAVMNAPQLLRNGNIGQFATNTAIGGGTGMALNTMIPSQMAGSALSQGPVASNIPSHLIGQQSLAQGITPNVTGAATSMGGANLTGAGTAPLNIADRSMMETLSRTTQPTQERVSQMQTPVSGPNLGQVTPPEPMDIATAGGAEVPQEESTFNKAYKNLKKYVEEKPVEAGLLGLTVGGSVYEGLKPKERPPLQPTLGPKLGGGQVNVGAPLQVRRSMRRRG